LVLPEPHGPVNTVFTSVPVNRPSGLPHWPVSITPPGAAGDLQAPQRPATAAATPSATPNHPTLRRRIPTLLPSAGRNAGTVPFRIGAGSQRDDAPPEPHAAICCFSAS